jgi:hypothetical protein
MFFKIIFRLSFIDAPNTNIYEQGLKSSEKEQLDLFKLSTKYPHILPGTTLLNWLDSASGSKKTIKVFIIQYNS